MEKYIKNDLRRLNQKLAKPHKHAFDCHNFSECERFSLYERIYNSAIYSEIDYKTKQLKKMKKKALPESPRGEWK